MAASRELESHLKRLFKPRVPGMSVGTTIDERRGRHNARLLGMVEPRPSTITASRVSTGCYGWLNFRLEPKVNLI